MAKCSVCGKGVTFGQNVSHSNRKTNRMWKPNIRRVKAVVDGTHKTVYVCSRCLRSGKVPEYNRSTDRYKLPLEGVFDLYWEFRESSDRTVSR